MNKEIRGMGYNFKPRELKAAEKKRLKKENGAAQFYWFNMNPVGCITTGDCEIRAVSLALEISWEIAIKALAEIGIANGRGPGCEEVYGKLLEANGFKRMKQPKKDDNTKYRTYELCLHLDKMGNDKPVVVSTRGHLLCIRQDSKGHNRVFDTWDSSNEVVGKYWIKE